MAESGVPDLNLSAWMALLAPEEVSRQITSDIKLHAELIKAAGMASQ
jgi:hypothetical protein